MTPSEKLQKLIEIATANGYKPLEGVKRVEDIVEERGIVSYYWPHSLETIIFSQSFIKALCKAKYGENADKFYYCDSCWRHHDSFSDCDCGVGNSWHPYEYHISVLALKTNRIDYLWDNFGGEGT